MKKTYQNIDIEGKDNGFTITKKGSKFCNEGKWKNFIEPFLPEDCSEKTFIEFGCNTGLFAKLAKERGFKKVIGIDKSRNAINVGIKYRDNLGLDYELINKSINDNFDYDLPLADVTLMSNFHYYLPINEMINLVHKMLHKTCYVLIVTAADAKAIRFRAKIDMPSIINYFKEWEVMKTKFPIYVGSDTFPRPMSAILLKNPVLERKNIKDIHKSTVFQPTTYDLVKRVIDGDIIDIRKLPYYKHAQSMMTKYTEKRVEDYVNRRIINLRDVMRDGMRVPIYVRSDGNIVDGTHRLILMKELGYKSIITYKIQ